jgi:plasmid maintenance system antidote protein VapI
MFNVATRMEYKAMNLKQRRMEMREAMERARRAEPPSFVPNRLLDTLIEHMGLKNDAQLSRRLGVPPPVISQMRHRKLLVGATMLLRMHEESGMGIAELKELHAESTDVHELATA